VQLSRRSFLAGLAAAVLAGPALADEAPARTRGWRWRGGLGVSARTAAGLVGPVVQAPYDFNAVGTAWFRPIAGPRLRTSPDGLSWGDWTTVTTHELHGKTPPSGQPYFGDLVVVPASRYVQVASDEPLDDLQLDLIDSAQGPTAAQLSARQALASVTILPRAAWGCDESLRYDASGAVIWPPEYFTTQKVVVHHTVTANQEADPAATVRAVYYYHAVTQGWGDIGYNYLVDWRGNVYEGRYGGPGVEAGHAYGHNRASIGIACLGTFSTASITFATRQSLARLIATRAPYLDPHDSSWFVDGDMPNLMGHRDAMRFNNLPTECPGDALYALLPGLRGDVLYNLGATPTPNAALLDVRYDGNPNLPGGVLTVHVTIRNTGSATLTSQDPEPGFLYNEGESYLSRALPGRAGAWRLGLDLSGGPAPAGTPFRWGLPDALEPGQSVQVSGQVRLADPPGTRAANLRLLREGRSDQVAGPAPASVRVIDPRTLTRRAAIPFAPSRSAP
jgi:hypothetical protein